MICVPKQLKDQRFIPLYTKNGEIHPLHYNWQVDNNYPYDAMMSKFANFYAYGVVLGLDRLYVIDFDSEVVQNKLLYLLPDTFQVKSGGKGLLHLYYYNDQDICWNTGIDVDNKRAIDVLGAGKMAIGPSSLHRKSRKEYIVVNNIPIATFPQSELKKILQDYFSEVIESKRDVINLKNSKAIKVIKCPFPEHKDTNPSLAIYKDSFFCFGCGRFGKLEVLKHMEVDF